MRTVEFLVQMNANMNVQDYSGLTAAMHSVIHKRIAVAQFLADSGADLTIRDKKGRLAYDIAIEMGRVDISKIFPNIDLAASLRRSSESIATLRRSIEHAKRLKTAG